MNPFSEIAYAISDKWKEIGRDFEQALSGETPKCPERTAGLTADALNMTEQFKSALAFTLKYLEKNKEKPNENHTGP